MPGVKGKTNNPNGRTPGATGLVTRAMRETIVNFAMDNFGEVVSLWNSIDDPSEKIKAYANIIEFGVARMARQELVFESDDDTTGIRIEVVKSKKPE